MFHLHEGLLIDISVPSNFSTNVHSDYGSGARTSMEDYCQP